MHGPESVFANARHELYFVALTSHRSCYWGAGDSLLSHIKFIRNLEQCVACFVF